MDVSPVTTDVTVKAPEKAPRVCQACGDVSIIQHHESGAPTRLEGHDTVDCDHITDFVVSFQPGAFGLLIPDQSSHYIWKMQTNGLMCSTRTLRGTYLPLSTPIKFIESIDHRKLPNPEDRDFESPTVQLTAQLAAGNHHNNTNQETVDLDPVWRMINEELPFTYRDVDAPTGYPPTEEAWRWIRITGVQDASYTDVSPLVGERVVFVYPNSD